MADARSNRPVRRMGIGYTPQEVRDGMWTCTLAWMFGAAYFALVTGGVFVAFLKTYLRADDLSYGLVNSAIPAAVIFQFAGSYLVERTGVTKRVFLIFLTLQRATWLAVAAIPLVLPPVPGKPATLQVALVGVFAFFSAAVGNFGGAGWTAWMSDIVPKSIAGTFFGVRARIGLLAMSVVSLGVTYLIGHFQHAGGLLYALAFALAAALGMTDILLFIRVREVPRPVEQPLPSLPEILATPWRDRVFRSYAVYTVVSWIGYVMMGIYVMPYCLDAGMGVFMATLLLSVIPMLTQAVASPFWGRAIDRFGLKPVLAASALAQIILPIAWLFIRPEWFWYIAVLSVAGGITWPGIDQVIMSMQVKGFPEARRTSFISMFGVVFGMAVMLGSILGGVAATFWQHHLHAIPYLPSWVSHYQPVFLTSILLRLVAFVVLLPRLPLPEPVGKGTVAKSIAKEMVDALPGMGTPKRKAPSGK